MQLNLLAFNMNVSLQVTKIAPQIVHSRAEMTNSHGCSGVYRLHFFWESYRREHSQETDHLSVLVMQRNSKHFQILKRLAIQECLRQQRAVNLLVEHLIGKNRLGHAYGTLTPWRSFQAKTCYAVILNGFESYWAWNPLLKVISCHNFDDAILFINRLVLIIDRWRVIFLMW